MVLVRGHWRATGWVQGHLRHPHVPGADQFGLVVAARTPIRFDPGRWSVDGVAPSSPLTDRPAVSVPSQRSPDDPARSTGRPAPRARDGRREEAHPADRA